VQYRRTVCRKKKILMKLTLVTPGLTWLDPHNGAELARDLTTPALSHLLGCARLSPYHGRVSDLLQQPFPVTGRPLAALAAEQAGLAPAGQDCLLVSPVHLRVDLSRALLSDSDSARLSQQEADQLLAALNQHFQSDGLHFCAPTPTQWFLHHAAGPGVSLTPLSDVVGENVDDFRPQGPSGLYWNRILNEIQMLLFGHPLNQQREQRGEVSINSVWLWGNTPVGQTDPSLAAAALYGDHAVTRLLARANARPLQTVPAGLDPLLQRDPSASLAWVWLDRLLAPACYRDAWGWREGLAELEQNWFSPLLAAMRQGRVTELNLVSHGEAGVHVQVKRRDLWKFWKAARPLHRLYP